MQSREGGGDGGHILNYTIIFGFCFSSVKSLLFIIENIDRRDVTCLHVNVSTNQNTKT